MMLSQNPRARVEAQFVVTHSGLVHPDYLYWAPIWARIRDAELGEIQVKSKGASYLPKQQGHDWEQYRSYLQRATFFNMTSKTLNALYGSLFRRTPVVTGWKPKGRFTKDGMSLHLTAKTAAKEVLTVGRYGLLVDAPADGHGKPYVASYTAENIIDWEMAEIDGVWQYIRVVLREASFDRTKDASPHQTTTRFRVLSLQPSPAGWQYAVGLFEDRTGTGVPDMRSLPDVSYVPTVRGRPLQYIPFIAIGPFSNTADVAKPPLLDIVTLNFSHYQSYAQLEQGRFYTANPVYTVSSGTADDESGEYYVGPDMVWELGKDGQAEILEFSGQGLSSLENALEVKEQQAAAIGARMMPSNDGPGQSDNALQVLEQNEQSLLLNLSDCLDEAFTTVMHWLADWNNVPMEKIAETTFEVAREFTTKKAGARELRAVVQMYKDGVLPLTVLFDYLRKNDVIPAWMDEDEFTASLKDATEFPNMVDVLARMNDFPDAATWHARRMNGGQA